MHRPYVTFVWPWCPCVLDPDGYRTSRSFRLAVNVPAIIRQ